MGDPTRCARVVVEELIGGGVAEVVLAPGSRSAPLAYALHAAEASGRLRLHVRVDERTAGFLALGLATASQAPVAVVTTSGTAAANLHPAVLEAWHGHVPLLAITADRPRGLAHAGANQTTDQLRLFGRHVRAEAQLDDDGGERSWRFELLRLVTAATGARTRLPGPVHLNVALSEPLTPTGPMPVPGQPRRVAAAPAAGAAIRLQAGPRTVLVAGDATPGQGAAASRLAEAMRLPLLAEPSSNARAGRAALGSYRLLLGSPLAEEIERVVVFGRPTLSRPVLRLLRRSNVELVVVSAYADWIDPGLSAAVVADAVEVAPDDGAWLGRWRQADQQTSAALAELLARQPELTGPGLAARVWAALGPADALVAGASNPIRDLDLAPISAGPPQVFANRGLSGIDGTVSTAVGIALARDQPTHALLGDLTFLHDANGLLIGPAEPRPDLRLVVANDDGGSIFATLEHGDLEHRDAFERLFGAPTGARLEHVAAANGCGYRRVETGDQLTAALAAPPTGLELVEAVVDRVGRRELTAQIDALGTADSLGA